jgi:hypothetical protein
VNERFWRASLEELKQGYVYEERQQAYVCLICGEAFEDGLIYEMDGRMYEARRFIHLHIESRHGSMLTHLLNLDKKATGLTDLQKELIEDFAGGMSDTDIVKKNGSGSASTIRNHRFALKERAKQAKLFLAIMEMIDKGSVHAPKSVPKPQEAAAEASTQAIGKNEYQAVIRQYFPEGGQGRLSQIPRKEKRRLAVLEHLSLRFELGRTYNEKEVNALLMTASEDEYVTLRRYLIEYGFLDRKDDGSAYWLVDREGSDVDAAVSRRALPEERNEDRMGEANSKEARKELVRQYQEKKREMGVYRIVHRATGKTWVGSSMNLDTVLNRDAFTLDLGSHVNRALQSDWTKYGKDAFDLDIIEQLKLDDTVRRDYKDIVTPEGTKSYVVQDYKRRLAERERHWIQELGCEEPAGYNKKSKGE